MPAAGSAAPPTAVVSLGDSYISGEAGRWLGNSPNVALDRDGTEVLSAQLPVGRRVNISCSGAVTQNLLRSSSGGTTGHREPPQGDQLVPVAKRSARSCARPATPTAITASSCRPIRS